MVFYLQVGPIYPNFSILFEKKFKHQDCSLCVTEGVTKLLGLCIARYTSLPYFMYIYYIYRCHPQAPPICLIVHVLHSCNLSSQPASFIICSFGNFLLVHPHDVDRCTTACDECVNCFRMGDIRIPPTRHDGAKETCMWSGIAASVARTQTLPNTERMMALLLPGARNSSCASTLATGHQVCYVDRIGP
jgi:hypothetical protein